MAKLHQLLEELKSYEWINLSHDVTIWQFTAFNH